LIFNKKAGYSCSGILADTMGYVSGIAVSAIGVGKDGNIHAGDDVGDGGDHFI